MTLMKSFMNQAKIITSISTLIQEIYILILEKMKITRKIKYVGLEIRKMQTLLKIITSGGQMIIIVMF